MKFDWHGGEITRSTIVDAGYKHTQNVRRFLAKRVRTISNGNCRFAVTICAKVIRLQVQRR